MKNKKLKLKKGFGFYRRPGYCKSLWWKEENLWWFYMEIY